jgi:hypothetical protein
VHLSDDRLRVEPSLALAPFVMEERKRKKEGFLENERWGEVYAGLHGYLAGCSLNRALIEI